MDEKEKARILKRFNDLIPHPECPMCHNHQFTVVDSYLTVPVADEYHKLLPVLKRAIPSVGIICTQCGYISVHAMATMGLINKVESTTNEHSNINNQLESTKDK